MWTTIMDDMGPGLIGFMIVGIVAVIVGGSFFYLADMITGIDKLKIMAEEKEIFFVVTRLAWIKKVLLWISVLGGIGVGYEALRLIVWAFASNQHAVVQAEIGNPWPPSLLPPVESAQQIYAHNIQSILWGMLYWLITVTLAVGIGSALVFIRNYFWTKAVNWVNKEGKE